MLDLEVVEGMDYFLDFLKVFHHVFFSGHAVTLDVSNDQLGIAINF